MERIHRAVSADGTQIAGRVSGQGPPLVLVHGSVADGESEWAAALPWLRERFTCYAMSTRGRGLSGHSDDLAPDRLVEDVTAFADSIGQPVRLAGVSGGGTLVLGAAARSGSVAAVACWEPVVLEVVPEQVAASFEKVVARMGELYAAGEHTEAVRTFLSFVGNEQELAALAAAGEFEHGARYLAVDLRELEQAFTAEGTSATDPSVLAKVTAPVLLLHGAESKQIGWFRDGVEFARAHLSDARVRVVPGVGHLSCQVTPEPIVRELLGFLTTGPRPA